MPSIEGYITKLERANLDNVDGIQITVFIPDPRYPGIVDQVFYPTEREFLAAEVQNKKDHEKYSCDMANMYSLCLEEVSIHPHRNLEGE